MKRPTPDTDAVAAYEGNWDTKALRMTVHARKLERERDDARKEFLIANDKMVEAECRVREIASVMEKVQRERDEARNIADELASIAAHCLGWHDHKSSDTAIKIAAALKRWKKCKIPNEQE